MDGAVGARGCPFVRRAGCVHQPGPAGGFSRLSAHRAHSLVSCWARCVRFFVCGREIPAALLTRCPRLRRAAGGTSQSRAQGPRYGTSAWRRAARLRPAAAACVVMLQCRRISGAWFFPLILRGRKEVKKGYIPSGAASSRRTARAGAQALMLRYSASLVRRSALLGRARHRPAPWQCKCSQPAGKIVLGRERQKHPRSSAWGTQRVRRFARAAVERT